MGLMLASLPVLPTFAADIRFVSPTIEVPVRRGQGTEYKILKLVKDGDRVELLKVNEAWAQVKVDNGTIGWMPKRYLSSEAPPLKLVQMLRSENEQLKNRDTERENELTELKDLHNSTSGELSACIAERDTIRTQYQTLQADTADVIALKNKMTATAREIEQVRATLNSVQQLNNELKRKTAITWFLAGGGVLMIGWIIGLITCRSRKKRPSLL